MNNQLHGLCSKCIQNFNSPTPSILNYICQRCEENQCQFISNDLSICLKCYLKEKESFSIFKKGSQLKQNTSGNSHNSSLTLVPKTQSTSSMISFLSRNGKIIKKLQKLLTSYDIKSNQIINQLNKKSLISDTNSKLTWQKVIEKCNKTSSLIYFFIGKQLIFGAFHTQSIKISQNSFIQDAQSGLFLTERLKYDLNIYRTNKNIVKYSLKEKKISFGDPSAFQISFSSKQIIVKSEFQHKLKWDHIFIYKV